MIKTLTAEGTSPETALGNLAIFDDLTNVTRAYIKANISLEEFATNFIGDDPVEGLGYYIVIKPAKKPLDTPKFKVVNHINKNIRTWATVVNFINDEGKVLETASTKTMPKAKAIKHAKSLAEQNDSSITITLSKEIVLGSDIIAEIQPKEDNSNGKYFFFGVEITPDNTVDA